MDKDNEIHGSKAIGGSGLRRSSRIRKFVVESEAKKGGIKDENAVRKVAASGKTRSKRKKKKKDDAERKSSSSRDANANAFSSFSSSPLTRQELNALLQKFTEDGHFRVNSSGRPQPSVVISKTTNGRSVTTKMEYYRPEEKFLKEMAATFVSHDASKGVADVAAATDVGKNEGSAMTFANPLPCGSGSTLRINTNDNKLFVTKYAADSSSRRPSVPSVPSVVSNIRGPNENEKDSMYAVANGKASKRVYWNKENNEPPAASSVAASAATTFRVSCANPRFSVTKSNETDKRAGMPTAISCAYGNARQQRDNTHLNFPSCCIRSGCMEENDPRHGANANVNDRSNRDVSSNGSYDFIDPLNSRRNNGGYSDWPNFGASENAATTDEPWNCEIQGSYYDTENKRGYFQEEANATANPSNENSVCYRAPCTWTTEYDTEERSLDTSCIAATAISGGTRRRNVCPDWSTYSSVASWSDGQLYTNPYCTGDSSYYSNNNKDGLPNNSLGRHDTPSASIASDPSTEGNRINSFSPNCEMQALFRTINENNAATNDFGKNITSNAVSVIRGNSEITPLNKQRAKVTMQSSLRHYGNAPSSGCSSMVSPTRTSYDKCTNGSSSVYNDYSSEFLSDGYYRLPGFSTSMKTEVKPPWYDNSDDVDFLNCSNTSPSIVLDLECHRVDAKMQSHLQNNAVIDDSEQDLDEQANEMAVDCW